MFWDSSFTVSDAKVSMDIEAKIDTEDCDLTLSAYHIAQLGKKINKFKIFQLQFNTGLIPLHTAAIRFRL